LLDQLSPSVTNIQQPLQPPQPSPHPIDQQPPQQQMPMDTGGF
jgi:hypothetical protein